MIWLLDTNIVSELHKRDPDPACVAWLQARAEDCAVTSITLSELRWGIERMVEGKHKAQRTREFEFLLEDYSGRFFEFDGPAASEWGRYAAELEAEFGSDWWKHYDYRDTQIAAIARVATRNGKHFPFCEVVNPFG